MSASSSVVGYLKDRRILPLIIVVLALAVLDWHYGIHFGIEFAGGTQIPITLAHPVNVTAMGALISALQQRVSTFGLKQATVEGIGNSEVYLTIPTVTQSEINQTIGIIESQGRFDAIVNGRESLNGSDLLKGSIGVAPPITSGGNVTWTVSFFITEAAAVRFSKVVFGQANQPEYLFLDRPSNAIILINSSQLGNQSAGVGPAVGLSAMRQALSWGSASIPVFSVSNSNESIAAAEAKLSEGSYREVIASANLNGSLISFLKRGNYTLKLENAQNMSPQYLQLSVNQTVIDTWPAVGLLSAPILNPDITNGTTSQNYEITGGVPASIPPAKRLSYANLQAKTIESILNGGALPVAIIAGTPTTVPPTLGQKFLYISGLTGIAAVIFVSGFIVIRYRKLFLIAPILITTLMELFIIVSVIGLLGTIDLAAVAGMIAVVGTGVDAQIIITDELLVHRGEATSAKSLLGGAFYIVWTDAILLTIVMLPLFFSTSLVSIIGFSESTIIGALLGVLITRPAYSAIVSRHYMK